MSGLDGLRKALITIGLVGVLLGAFTAYAILTSDHVDKRGVETTLALTIGWGFIGAGLVAWWRRPENNFGPLMTATGFLFFVSELGASNLPWVLALSGLFGNLFLGVVVHMLLAMPSGRLQSGFERAFVGFTYFFTAIPSRSYLFFLDPVCEGCPGNPVALTNDPELAHNIDLAINWIALALFGLVVFLLLRHWRAAGAAERRTSGPVILTGCGVLLFLEIALMGQIAGNPDIAEASYYATQIAILPLPFVFLAALLRGRLARAGAVGAFVAQLRRTPGRGEMGTALAEVLGDPTLELAYWLPEEGRYVDAAGAAVALPTEGARSYTTIDLDGRPVAAIVHDSVLAEDPQHLEAVGAAAALALDRERLDAELRARLVELKASRARIVEAGLTARRRIERDLHDGAQQRLVSLALEMRAARSRIRTDPEEAESGLDAAATELDMALAELRELARGIHPAVLSDRGLPAALTALAGRAPFPVTVESDIDERLPEAPEAAAYFVAAEALTNAVRHAEADTASIRLSRDDGRLLIEISDDGRGGVDPEGGSGLRGLADRVAALDGVLVVESPAGEGTTLRATIPV